MAAPPASAASAAAAAARAPQAEQGQPSPTPQPPRLSEVEDGVVRQIEWYFGPINLPRDFYLQGKMDHEYWVDLKVILAFPKMKALGIADPHAVSELLQRGSTRVDADTTRNCVRPAWAHRSILALSPTPPGTSAAKVEALFADAPAAARPAHVALISDKDGVWHVVFEASDGARQALDHVKEMTMGEGNAKVTLTAHVFPVYDVQAMTMASFGLAPSMSSMVLPGQPLGGAFYDGHGSAASMPPGYAPGPVPPGMIGPQMNGLPLPSGANPPVGAAAYGYGFSPGPGGASPSNFSITGGAGAGAGAGGGGGAGVRAGYPGAGNPYYMNAYGLHQGMYDPSMAGGPQSHAQHGGGSSNGKNRPPTAQMEAAAAAAAAQAHAGALAGNVNVGGHGSKISSIAGGAMAADGSQQQTGVSRIRPNNRRPHGQNVGGSSPQQAGRAQGYDPLASPAARNGGGSGNNRSSPGPTSVSLGEFVGGTGRAPAYGTPRGGFKVGAAPFGASTSPGAGSVDGMVQHRGPKGHAGDATMRPGGGNVKNKKKRAANRQVTGSNGPPPYSNGAVAGEGGEMIADGKKPGGDEPRKGPEYRKNAKAEPNLTAMYFPPLPGAAEGSLPKAPQRSPSARFALVVANGEADKGSSGAVKTPKSPTSAPASAPTGASTGAPSEVSTGAPTGAPTGAETGAGMGSATGAPTGSPTGAPTGAPRSAEVPAATVSKDEAKATGAKQETGPTTADAESPSTASTGQGDSGVQVPSGDGKDEETPAVAEKSVPVSDVSSTVSSGSGSLGANGASPGGVSSTPSHGSVDEPPPAPAGGGISYASIVRKAKKLPPPPPPPAVKPEGEDSKGKGAASGKADSTEASGGVSAGEGKDSTMNGVADDVAKGNAAAEKQGDKDKKVGATVADGGKNAKSSSTPVAIAPRSVWANKPKSVLQATPAVKPAAKPAVVPLAAGVTGATDAPASNAAGTAGHAGTNGVLSSQPVKGKMNGVRGASGPVKHISMNGKADDSGSAPEVATAVKTPPPAIAPKGVWGQNPKVWSKELTGPEKVGMKSDP